MSILYSMRISYLFVIFYQILSLSDSQDLCKDEPNHENCTILPDIMDCGKVKIHYRIVGGKDAKLEDFPWTALLHRYGVKNPDFYLDEFICGGAIISEQYVVTAAHCFGTDVLNTVRVGEYNVSSEVDCFRGGSCAPPPQDLEIESVVFPPDSDKNRISDIALVRLKQKIIFNDYVSPICLPTAKQFMNETFLQNKTLEVVGWGLDVRKDNLGVYYHDVLQDLRLPYVFRQECTRISGFSEPLDEGKLCAGGVEHQDSCRGDSGGPLTGHFTVDGPLRNYLLGIVSFGRLDCYQGGFPGVYTNVPYYTSWIINNLRH